MKARLHIALASAVLVGVGLAAACSAPDPGDVTITQRYSPSSDGGSTASSDGGGGGGTKDGGSTGGGDSGGGGDGGGGGTGAFKGEGAYTMGTATETAKGQNGHKGLLDAADPTGMNCLQSGCHGGTNPAGTKWGFAGTAYLNATTPGPAGVEIRVIGTDGTQYDSVYTDANGNFFSPMDPTKFPATPVIGARCATVPNNTMSATGGNACNSSGCHLSGANPMLAH